jgi:hypothetical protein
MDDNHKSLRSLALAQAAPYDPSTCSDAWVEAASPDVVVGLLDELAAANAEVERLMRFSEDAVVDYGQLQVRLHETQEQLADVTAAKNEACDIAVLGMRNVGERERIRELRSIGTVARGEGNQ